MALAPGAIGVIAQPLGISHGDEKEREGTGLMAEVIDHVLTDQALIDPAELWGHLVELGQRNGKFGHTEDLLLDERIEREYRAPIVAGVGSSFRCHLATYVRLNER